MVRERRSKRRERIELDKDERCMKIDPEKAKTFETIKIEKEKVRLMRITKESRIILYEK